MILSVYRRAYAAFVRALFVATVMLTAALLLAQDNAQAPGSRVLGRGINLGNALEAPREGEWGVTLREKYFDEVKSAGFQSVRIPVRWSAHTDNTDSYSIDAEFFKRVDWAIGQSLKHELTTVINVHHFNEIHTDPARHESKLIAIWKQVAQHYRDQPDTLMFELLNEPNGKLTEERWNKMIPKLLETIRATNPDRLIIVGPGMWNGIHSLDSLSLPADDQRIIVTFHYYLPFHFTHQRAPWIAGSDRWRDTEWTGSDEQLAALASDFEKVAAWAKKNDRPILLGEFGAYSAADMPARAAWTRAVVHEAEKHNFGWTYWEFCSGFGAYDPKTETWREPLLSALMQR